MKATNKAWASYEHASGDINMVSGMCVVCAWGWGGSERFESAVQTARL